ncbi:hypothetical protein FB593_1283 [Rhizobium sp. SJZ105]|uniref:hypothetical protein n=1 Tax=Rhizobium sp. SJZ105 TaxID=2572678 RepID=UPI0011A105A1|nr:hypothetical protein [Rhizobium sp. SJZ105]TWC75764.1 hypothetical protein FB593_1283 [Rhizobium sp. SJZ105]
MVSSVSNISTSSVALLFGTSGAASTGSSSAASKILADATGHTDDVFKAGNAIGNIIEIASRMKQDAAGAGGKKVEVEVIDLANDQGRILNEFDGGQPLHEVKGTYTRTDHGNGERTETFVGNFKVNTDEGHRQRTIDVLKGDQSTLRNRTMLAAYENGTIEETDFADLGFKTEAVRTTEYYSDGSAHHHVALDSKSAVRQVFEQYTEMRDGVMYDKATGKFAAIDQNGSKFTYLTW